VHKIGAEGWARARLSFAATTNRPSAQAVLLDAMPPAKPVNMKNPMRALVGVAGFIALMALASLQQAAASDLTDACNGVGNGMFQPKDCTCFDGKVTDSGERATLMTYFKTMGTISKGQQADMTGDVAAQMQKASSELLPKYVAECTK
jgi:hypothetical protein